MSTPYGGNDPQQWGQAPNPGSPSGGFPAPGYPVPPNSPQPGYGQPYPPYAQPPYGQPQYGQPQYGQQYPQQQYGQYEMPPGPGGRKKIGKAVWIVAAVVVVVVAAVCVTGFVKPGFFVTAVFDQNAVQDGVRTVLTAQPPNGYGQSSVGTVSCPAKQPVKAGTTFDCTAVVNGDRKTVTITVKDSDGNYEVGQPH